MKCRKLIYPLVVFLALVFVGAGTLTVNAYTPTAADMIFQEGLSKSVAVQIVNLTPYDMKLDTTNSKLNAGNTMDTNRNNTKVLLFTPVGVPNLIPKAIAGAESYPCSFIIGFKDVGSNIIDNATARWTMSGVLDGSPGATATVEFAINVNRDKPAVEMKSGLFPLIADVVKECIEVSEVAVEPENPMAWVKAFLATAELGKGAVEFGKENSKPQEGAKIYGSAYILPKVQGGTPGTIPVGNTNGTADDGVITQEPPHNQYAQSSIYAINMILRNPVPQMMVTLVTDDTLTAATTSIAVTKSTAVSSSQAGTQLKTSLQQQGKQGSKNLLALVKSLKTEQKQQLLQLANALVAGKKLDPTQEEFLKKIATAHKTHSTSI